MSFIPTQIDHDAACGRCYSYGNVFAQRLARELNICLQVADAFDAGRAVNVSREDFEQALKTIRETAEQHAQRLAPRADAGGRAVDLEIVEYGGQIRVTPKNRKGGEFLKGATDWSAAIVEIDHYTLVFETSFRDTLIFELLDNELAASFSF